MLFKVLLLLGALSFVTCNCASKQFCFPKQWQSRLSISNVSGNGHGNVQIVPESGAIFIDTVGERVRTDFYSPDANTTFLVLIKEHIGYEITNNAICRKFKPVKFNFTFCTPEQATVSYPYRLGFKPAINVVDYGFPMLVFKALFSVSDNTAPVALRLFTKLSGVFSVLNTVLFEDYLPAIPNPKVFEVPDICRHLQQESANLWQVLARGEAMETIQ